MYQHKLANLNKQLEDLKQLSHPEYIKRLKKLEYQYKERLRLNEIYRDYLKECVERDYILEKKAAQKEYDEKKVYKYSLTGLNWCGAAFIHCIHYDTSIVHMCLRQNCSE